MCYYNHKICSKIDNQRNYRPSNGVGIAVMNKRNQEWFILLGKEVSGDSANTWNVCTGYSEKEDKGCYLNNAIRELKEEFKIIIDINNFDNFFRRNEIKYFYCEDAPIFVGLFPKLDTSKINKVIEYHFASKMPSEFTEISNVEWFRLSDSLRIDGTKLPISPFANKIILELKNSSWWS
jgi:8-oxo-dGTP pyrophosphatase MutT (NUDIX family)